MVNLRRGKYDLVKDDVSVLTATDPQNPLGTYLNAFLMSQNGKYRDAAQALLTVPQLLDNYPPGRLSVGSLLPCRQSTAKRDE